MRFFIIFAGLFLISGCGRPASLSFSPPQIELGKIYSGEIRSVHVKLENSGDRPASIGKIQGSCNCLILPSPLPQTVASHSSVDIQVDFHSLGYTGTVSRDLIAQQNPKGTASCEIRGNVVEFIRYPTAINVTVVPQGKLLRRSFSFEARQPEGDGFHLKAVGSSDPQTLRALKFTDTPLHQGQKGEVQWCLTPNKLGWYHETLFLELDQPAVMKMNYDVYGYVDR